MLTFSGNSQQILTGSGSTAVVDRTASALGAGWAIDGISQLYAVTGGILWVTGQGDSRFFAGVGSGPQT